MVKEKDLIPVDTVAKKDYILYNEEIEGKVREFLNRYHKIEVKLISILDNIIVSKKMNYSGKKSDFERIRKLLDEMESFTDESNTGKDEGNSVTKS